MGLFVAGRQACPYFQYHEPNVESTHIITATGIMGIAQWRKAVGRYT
jgi:hypothetical protein